MWVYLLACNLIRLLKAQSARLADDFSSQHSFKHTLQLWAYWSQQAQAFGFQADEGILFMLAVRKTFGNRPGRAEPRAIKQRPKSFPLLMTACVFLKDKDKKHGHPEKARAYPGAILIPSYNVIVPKGSVTFIHLRAALF